MAGPIDWDEEAGRLAARSYAAGEPTGWFDRLYSAAATGDVTMPWSRTEGHPLLVAWARERGIRGDGGRAVVVGCGLGADAEYVAGLGFRTVGFDIAATAIRLARERFPESTVDYQVADLLDLPPRWARAFDLVVDVNTVQSLPDPPRRTAIRHVPGLVAPDGRLLVIAARREDGDLDPAGPPWPLTRAEVDAYAVDGLRLVRVESVTGPRDPAQRHWLAELHRPGD